MAIFEFSGESLDELEAIADGTIYPFIAQYNGNANSGRFLEVFSGLGSDQAPELVPVTAVIESITFGTVSTSGAFTVGIFEAADLVTPIHTISLVDGIGRGFENNIGVSVSAEDELVVKVTAGSRNKPFMKIWVNTSGV
jgi:hypothetical protein